MRKFSLHILQGFFEIDWPARVEIRLFKFGCSHDDNIDCGDALEREDVGLLVDDGLRRIWNIALKRPIFWPFEFGEPVVIGELFREDMGLFWSSSDKIGEMSA
jgi:hypothetical protein